MDINFLAFVKSELAHLKPVQFEEVSKATGISIGTIRKIHYGEVEDPRVSSVQALYDFFRAGGLACGARPEQVSAATSTQPESVPSDAA